MRHRRARLRLLCDGLWWSAREGARREDSGVQEPVNAASAMARRQRTYRKIAAVCSLGQDSGSDPGAAWSASDMGDGKVRMGAREARRGEGGVNSVFGQRCRGGATRTAW
jgi:hypothetical protein